MPAALAHALQASLDLIEGQEGHQRRARLAALIGQLRAGLWPLLATRPAWSLPESSTAIQPLLVGSNDNALSLSAALEQRGLWVPAIRPPTVPVGTARLRITLSASHRAEEVQCLLDALADEAGVLA